MEDLETKKLRDSLVEYEGHLSEMRNVTQKSVETLDVIQRYTDKSAAGMQALAEQGLNGVQKVTAESAGGLRRIVETGTSNISRLAEGSEAEILQVAERSRESIANLAQECLDRLQGYTKEGTAQISAAVQRSQESAAAIEKIEQSLAGHMETMKDLIRQSDDFTHRENVKVYRNVQAVVVDEVKKQTAALAEQNEELVNSNEKLAKQNRSLRTAMIITLVAALANLLLMIAQTVGLF